MENKSRIEMRSAEARLQAFSTLGHRLSSARTQQDAIRIILDIADQFFGWDACTFHSYSRAEDIVRAVIMVDRVGGARRDVVDMGVKTEPPTPRMRQVIEEGPLLILRQEPIQMPADSVPIGDEGRASASLMYVPVRSSEEIIGFLSIQNYTPNAYTQEDLNLLQALADHGAGALDRIQAEEKMKALNSELEDRIAERTAALMATVGELEAFSYSVSHDMRAPLRSMHGFAQLLLEDYSGKVLDATAADYLGRIARSAARLDSLIQDVLHYARVVRTAVTKVPVDVEALIRDVLDAHPQWGPPHAQVEVVSPLPRLVGNEALLSQCVSNLLSNAIKFVADGVAPHVTIFAEAEGSETRLCFQDNGMGIDPQHHARIFRIFERLHPSTDFEGTGIGLSIVRKAAERMGGQVGCRSTAGAGSTFWIQLPTAD